MTHIIDTLGTDWDTGNGVKPAMGKREENEYILDYYEGIVGGFASIDDEYNGLGDQQYYTPDSHDAYFVEIVAETRTRLDEIIKEVKRICAEFTPSGSDTMIRWSGGEVDPWNNTRFETSFIILIYKSGISI